MLKSVWMGAASLALMLLVSACGSRNDDDLRASWARNAYPTLSEDSIPSGPRTDYASRNLFAATTGDTWTFDRTLAGATTAGALNVTVPSADSAGFALSRTENGVTSTRQYRRTSQGIVLVNPLPDAPSQAQRIVGEMLWYPQPFYAPGERRRMVRQGSWGADLNADGAHESFRYTVEQVFVGFEPVTIPNGTVVQAARFQTTETLLMISSDPNAAPTMTTVVEETWWAPGLGMVRLNVSDGSTNAANSRSYVLSGGRVGGVSIDAPAVVSPVATADGRLTAVALTHEALVYDPTRQRYYASVSGGEGAGSVAVIDAATGAVTYSERLGAQPTVMAISPDGSYLHVGVKDTGEVVKLQLPSMMVSSRRTLPQGAAGELQYAVALAVWPGNPVFVAASVARDNAGTRESVGVSLFRAGDGWTDVMATGPLRQDALLYNATGDTLYGVQLGSPSGLTRSTVQWGDTLTFEESRLVTGATNATGMDVSAQGIWLGTSLYRSDNLTPVGQASVTGPMCRASAVVTLALCLDTDASMSGSGRMAVVDPTTFATVGTSTYMLSGLPAQPTSFVVGGPKQVALRFGPAGAASTLIWLHTSDKLP